MSSDASPRVCGGVAFYLLEWLWDGGDDWTRVIYVVVDRCSSLRFWVVGVS